MRLTMEQHKSEYRARPFSERLHAVFAEVAAVPNPAQVRAMARPQMADFKPCPAKAYKPPTEATQDDHLLGVLS